MKESFYIPQDCIPNKQSRILVRHYSSVDHDLLPSHPTVLGMSLQLSSRGEVKALALATSEDVLLISPNSKSNISPTDSLLADILTCKSFPLAGFDMARMALHLSNDWNYQVRGVDISDALSLAGDKRSPSNCVGSKLGVNVDSSRIDEVWKIDAVATAVCIRAWISAVSVLRLFVVTILITELLLSQYLRTILLRNFLLSENRHPATEQTSLFRLSCSYYWLTFSRRN